MKAEIYKVRRGFSDEVEYMTERQFANFWKEERRVLGRPKGIFRCISVDIPETLKPTNSLEGHVYVLCDGVRYELGEVLGADGQGDPAVVWKDERYGYPHRVKLRELVRENFGVEHGHNDDDDGEE